MVIHRSHLESFIYLLQFFVYLGGSVFLCFCSVLFFFLGLHLLHMDVPRLGVKSELKELSYAPVTAILDQRCICDLHHSYWQHQILNSPSKARDRIHIVTNTHQLLNLLSHNGGPWARD